MKEVLEIVAGNGLSLSATWFIAENGRDKVVLVNPATGVKQQYYADFATWLTTLGFNVYTFDYRGIGASRPDNLRNVSTDMSDWSTDVDAMISHITRIHPRAKLVIIGHSVGGQLIGMAQLSRHANAIVMVGAQTPFWRNYDGRFMRLKLWLFWYVVIPAFTRVFGYFPAALLGLFENLPAAVAMQWSRWAKNPNYIFDELPEARNTFEKLSQRALLISFTDDMLAPPRAVLDLKRFYRGLKLDHWHYNPEDVRQRRVGHFGFFKKRMEPVMWRATADWIVRVLSEHGKRTTLTQPNLT